MSKFFDHCSGELRELNFDFGRGTRLRAEVEALSTTTPRVGDDWANAMPTDNEPEPALPEGVSESGGTYFADCCCCGRACDVSEWIGTDETEDIDFEDWYGCCGPSCCR